MSASTVKPILALTMGDPVGVGPEIIVKALADARIYQACRPLVLGDLPALERARLALDPALKIHLTDRPAAGRYQHGTLDLMPGSQLTPADLKYGRPTPASGAAMVGYVLTAIDLALAEKVAGLVTAPISKISMKLSGYDYPGHTELLAEKTKTAEFAMMLAGGEFRVILVTIHCALSEVPKKITQAGLVRLFHLAARALDRDFGLAGVPLGVAALNPHASEDGMFGHEEERIIIPAVKEAQAAGLAVEGPFPADTLFWRHQSGGVRRHHLHVPRPGPHPPQTPALHGRGERHPGAAHHPHQRRPRHRLQPGRHRPGRRRIPSRPRSSWPRRWRSGGLVRRGKNWREGAKGKSPYPLPPNLPPPIP